MKIDPANLNLREGHHLLVDVLVPRPIAWVSTVDGLGVNNLAPFSAYGMISSKPALVGIGVSSYRDGKEKDTARNIKAMKEFVINFVTESLAEKMNQTAAPYPPEVSEFKEAKLTPVKSDLVKPPRVGESPISMECRLIQSLQFGAAPTINNFFIGEVLRVHIKDEFWVNGTVDIAKLKAIGRLGGDMYCRLGELFEMKRPTL